MNKNTKRQNYQEVEAQTHTTTATAKVVALHPDRQPLETASETVATEVQPIATALQFPATQEEIAEALGVSRQAIGKAIKALRTVYDDFPHLQIENAGRITELGFQALKDKQESQRKGRAYLQHLRSQLERQSRIVEPTTEVTAIAPIDNNRFQSAITHIDTELADLNIEMEYAIDALGEVEATSIKFDELMLKKSALKGAKLGANMAKIEISAMQKTRNQLMEKVLEDMGLE